MFKAPLLAVALGLSAIGLSACTGGIGLGSLLGPEVAAKPTEQDREKLGAAGSRLDAIKKRADAVINDVSKPPLNKTQVGELARLEDEADRALTIWGRDPRDTQERLNALQAISEFEREVINLESR